MTRVEVGETPASGLREPLRLLEEWLRDGEPVPEDFVRRMRGAVKAGDVDVLEARREGEVVGVAAVAYRLNVALGGYFASVEDLYVRPDTRRGGVGRELLRAVGDRCAARGVSYIEAQVEGEEAAAFYRALGYEAEPGVRVLSLSLPTDREPETGARSL